MYSSFDGLPDTASFGRDTQANGLTSNFQPQDIDRFGEPILPKKQVVNIPGPGSYSQSSVHKLKGGVINKAKRVTIIAETKKGPGP